MAKTTKLTASKKFRMWHRAILALIQEPTVAAAASLLKISERTLEMWLRDPEFIKQLQTAQQTAVGHGMVTIQMNLGRNIHNLQEIADDKTVSAAVRAGAAGKLIDIVIGVQKQQSNARYIEQLENQLRQLHAGNVEEEDNEEEDDEETRRPAARASQRQRELPPIGGSFGADTCSELADGSHAEGEASSEGDGEARRANSRTRKGK